MAKKKLVVHTFYADGQSIWIAERPTKMSEEELRDYAIEVEESTGKKPDAVTDTTGRLVRL